MRVTVVDFFAEYGDKEKNLRAMEQVLRLCQGKTDLVLFPEMALTGYENEPELPWERKMQVRLAEPVPGDSTRRIGAVCRETGLYAAFGLPERREGRVYNAAAVLSPDGQYWCYEKMHLPGDEPSWAEPGQEPLTFPTPWGPVAVAICYDVYKFPEVARRARCSGAALLLNLTACAAPILPEVIQLQTAFAVQSEGICIASANLTGRGKRMDFFGGSNVLCPGKQGAVLLAGRGFSHGRLGEPALWTAQLPENREEGVAFSPERSAGAWRRLLNRPEQGTPWRGGERPDRRILLRVCLGIEEALRAREDLLVLSLSGEEELDRLSAGLREQERCAAVQMGDQLTFLQPAGVVTGVHALTVDSPWGRIGMVTGESMLTQFEEYRALCAQGAQLLLVPGGQETGQMRLAERCACVTGEVPVAGPRQIWTPFGSKGLPREAGRVAEIVLTARGKDRRLHVFSQNPLTGRMDLRPECYLRFWQEWW